MKRRDFITLLGAAAAAWPLAARAQQSEPMRRIGILVSSGEDDEGKPRIAAFQEHCSHLVGSRGASANRMSGGAEVMRKVFANTQRNWRPAPDIILANGSATVGPLLQATRTVPIVFAYLPDPVGAGFVDSLSRPGGNATGFTRFEYSTSGKWLELLKEIAPSVTRVAVIRDAAISTGLGQFVAIQA